MKQFADGEPVGLPGCEVRLSPAIPCYRFVDVTVQGSVS